MIEPRIKYTDDELGFTQAQKNRLGCMPHMDQARTRQYKQHLLKLADRVAVDQDGRVSITGVFSVGDMLAIANIAHFNMCAKGESFDIFSEANDG